MIITAIALFVVVGMVFAWQVRQRALNAQDRLTQLRETLVSAQSAVADPDSGDAATAQGAVEQACSQADELDRELGPVPELAAAAGPAGQLVAHVPQVGQQAGGLLALSGAAGDAFAAMRLACDALTPMLQAQATGGDLSQLVAALGANRDRLRQASARLGSAGAQLATVDEQTLDESTRRVVMTLRERLPAVRARFALLAEVPGLLGYDGPSTFLVLGQNPDELRPTGGFIGTAGILTFDGGKLSRREYGSSFSLSLPPDQLVTPPAALTRYMDAGYWQLREANWWPDYPSSARQARYFYDLVRPDGLNGVVAIDQELIFSLLGLTGPIDLPEYGEHISADNARERLEYYVHQRPSGSEQARKGFVTALFSALLDRVSELPKSRFRELATVLERALNDQHVLLWAQDDRTQQAFADLAWDGRMLTTPGDYLFPVSSNVSMNKVNRDVEQEIEYQVSQEPAGRLVGQATLVLRNRRASDDPGPYRTADYLDYFRLYVPTGSELISTDGFDDVNPTLAECGRTAFGGLVRVSPGQERRLRLSYRLPAELSLDGYRLVVQKQPGLGAFPLRVVLPGGEQRDSLKQSRAYAFADGQFSSGPPTPASNTAGGPACAVVTEPPRALQPPSRLEIAGLNVAADFVTLGVDPDGTLQAPRTGTVVGWYDLSARPGQVGNMVVSGHLDWDKQPGVFFNLRQVKPGDPITVVAQGGARYRYDVEWTRSFDASNAPLDEILGPTTRQWLTLITCDGKFDPSSRSYLDRMVVRARLVATE